MPWGGKGCLAFEILGTVDIAAYPRVVPGYGQNRFPCKKFSQPLVAAQREGLGPKASRNQHGMSSATLKGGGDEGRGARLPGPALAGRFEGLERGGCDKGHIAQGDHKPGCIGGIPSARPRGEGVALARFPVGRRHDHYLARIGLGGGLPGA